MWFVYSLMIIGSVYTVRNKKLKDSTKTGYFIGEIVILLLCILGAVL